MILTVIALKRRSVRKYDPAKGVTKEEIEAIVRFAQEAPSWKNQQTTRYYVAMNQEIIDAVRESFAGAGNFTKTIGVGALIISTFRHNIVGFNREGQPDNDGGNSWGWYDQGMQNAYLLLKAAELGLDTLVIGIRSAEVLRRVCQIPDTETIGAVIAVGHRAEGENPARPPRKELEEILTFL